MWLRTRYSFSFHRKGISISITCLCSCLEECKTEGRRLLFYSLTFCSAVFRTYLGITQANHLFPVFYCGRVDKEDEMTCLIKGCNFVLKNIPHEAFVYAKHADSEFRFQTTYPDIFPYLLVNIGSGVSIVKVKVKVCVLIKGGCPVLCIRTDFKSKIVKKIQFLFNF